MECYEILNSEYNMTIAPINPWQPWLPAQALKTNTQKDTTVGSALVDTRMVEWKWETKKREKRELNMITMLRTTVSKFPL